MKKIIVILILLVFNLAMAGDLVSLKDTKDLSDQLMAHFLRGEFQEGLGLAKPFWPLPPVEIDGLANQIATQWPMVQQRFGTTTGQEFIKEERLGNSFVRYYFLHKFENHSIYWRFTFYKPQNSWKVNGIQFLDELSPLFEKVK